MIDRRAAPFPSLFFIIACSKIRGPIISPFRVDYNMPGHQNLFATDFQSLKIQTSSNSYTI